MMNGLRCKIINIFVVSMSMLAATSVFAQVSEGGSPPSFALGNTLRNAVAPVEAPVNFRVTDLLAADKKRANNGAPRVAQLIAVDYTMNNAGYRTTLPDGEQIWRLRIRATGAVAIMLYYQDFYIPQGAKLFIYSADHKHLLGAYTNRSHPSGGLFATGFIGGDDLTLEYVESTESNERPRIHICDIGYGYDAEALRAFTANDDVTTRAQSGECMVNINCQEGEAWQNEKKGVCHTIQRVGDVVYICTATLMNNTAEDFRPLILTARHCGCADSDYECASYDNLQQWLFYFHYEMENCSSGSRPVEGRSMTGCRLLAYTAMSGQTDGMLLELNNMIPEDYNVYYNGWDRRQVPAQSGVGIHHPRGDFKKISTFTDEAFSDTFDSEEFVCAEYAHWNVKYVATANGHGETEGGSSGSPLFNENKLVVGTLTGGGIFNCKIPGIGSNLYGKLSEHWNRYKINASTGMDEWLDPMRTGTETLRGRYRHLPTEAPPLNLKIESLGYQAMYLSWNAPDGYERPILYNIYRNNQKIGAETGLSYVDAEADGRYAVYAVTAVYAGYRESVFVQIDARADDEQVDATDIGIFPARFTNHICIKGGDRVVRIEAIALSGKICLTVKRNDGFSADETIDTSSLPSGFYVFRLYEADGRATTVKTMKTLK